MISHFSTDLPGMQAQGASTQLARRGLLPGCWLPGSQEQAGHCPPTASPVQRGIGAGKPALLMSTTAVQGCLLYLLCLLRDGTPQLAAVTENLREKSDKYSV